MDTMTDKLDRDLASAIEDGTLDPARHAALMEAARRCARTIDSTPSPNAAMFSSMLHYIKALGVAPTNAEIDRRRKPKPSTPSKLDLFRQRRASRGVTPVRDDGGNADMLSADVVL
ncbi:MAG: hypothetical protein IJG82_01305 [Atopobiaceae bacterium]|nr:hypothetical protein [Atopobiaceae bacterium]